MRIWPRSDSLTAIGIGVAIAGLVATVALPESRRFIGFDCGGHNLLGKIFHHSFCQHFAASLVGTWKSTVQDSRSGQQVSVRYHIYDKGRGCYQYIWEDGRQTSDDFNWNYENNLIIENFTDNHHMAQTQLNWIDDNHIEATVIDDNVYPPTKKIKRDYYRENG
jgi:hypothetical protein